MQEPRQDGDDGIGSVEEWVEDIVDAQVVVVDLDSVAPGNRDSVMGAVQVVDERCENHVVVLPEVADGSR